MWRNIKEIFLFFCLLVVHLPIAAQDKNFPVLTGMVVNSAQNPIEGSAVALLKSSDSTIVKLEICNKKGYFNFNNLKQGRYLIRVTSLSYQDLFYGPFTLNDLNKTTDLGKIQLRPALNALKEVSIIAQKNFITLMPGKVVLNIENSIWTSGHSAFDILKIAPGVQMDADDNIRLNGKQNVLVMLNGKQTFMEGQALQDILKNMQSNEIELIELISNPSAKFNAAGSGSIINIKTLKNKQFGANGSLNGNSGFSLINADDVPNLRVGSGISLNFRNKALNLFGNYSYGDVTQDRNNLIDRDINNSLKTAINVDYKSLTRRRADSYRFGADVHFKPLQVVGIMFTGSDNHIQINKSNRSSIFNLGNQDSTIITQSDQSRRLNTQVLNLNYHGSLGKKAGELSFDWDHISYKRNSMELLTNNFLDAGNNPYRGGLLLSNDSPSDFEIQSVKLDYNVDLNKNSQLALGLQGSQVRGDSRLDFGEIKSAVFYPNMQFANHFLMDEEVAAGYFNYHIEFKKTSFSVGMRAEKTFSKGTSLTTGQTNSRKYLNLFPNFQATHDLNKNNKLLFSYSRRITRPGYDNLNPFVAYLDQYSYRSGNPLLKPEFTRIAEITHSYKSKFSTTLRARIIDDLMLEINEQDDITQVNTIINRNFDRQYLYGIELNAPVNLTNWWEMNLNLQSVYERYVANTILGKFENTSPSLIFSSLQSFKLNNTLSAEINAKYESPTVFGIYDYRAAYTVDAALAKSLFKKNANLRVRISDLFNTSINRYSSTYQNLNLRSIEKRDSMVAQLSFSYLFGRRTVKGIRKRDTGSEDEQGRIGTL